MSVIKVARSFRLDKDTDDTITELMKTEHRSRNNLVDILLEEAIQNRKAKHSRRKRQQPVQHMG